MDLNWNPRYSVGHPLLDEQHRSLLALCVRAERLAASADPATDKAFNALLNELVDYACQHFRSEEAVLAEQGYPALAAHCALHHTYEEAIAEILVAATRGLVKKDEVFRFVSNWWLRHILEDDRQYAPWTGLPESWSADI